MIVFGIHSNFFIVLPIQLKTSVFSILQGKMCAPEKSGALQRFYAPELARLTSGAQFLQAFLCIDNR